MTLGEEISRSSARGQQQRDKRGTIITQGGSAQDSRGRYYVRLDDGTIITASAVNSPYTVAPGVVVYIRERIPRLPEIVRLDPTAAEARFGADGIRLGMHLRAASTYVGTGNEIILDARLMAPGLVTYKTGLTVTVQPTPYLNDVGNWAQSDGGDVDLTSSVPGSPGQRRYTLIEIAASDGSINTIDLTATSGLLNVGDATGEFTDGNTPLALVGLVNGDTMLSEGRIVDARLFPSPKASRLKELTIPPYGMTPDEASSWDVWANAAFRMAPSFVFNAATSQGVNYIFSIPRDFASLHEMVFVYAIGAGSGDTARCAYNMGSTGQDVNADQQASTTLSLSSAGNNKMNAVDLTASDLTTFSSDAAANRHCQVRVGPNGTSSSSSRVFCLSLRFIYYATGD